MAETAIYLALRKLDVALELEKSAYLGQEHGGRSTFAREHRASSSRLLHFLHLSEGTSEDVTGAAELHNRLLRRIKSELVMIHCFLDQVETRYNNSQVLQSWIEETRRLGCLVEQTVDDYVVLRTIRTVRRGFSFNMERERFGLGDRPLIVLSPRRLIAQLTEIEDELEHLSRMKIRWVPLDKETSSLLPSSFSPPYATSKNTWQCQHDSKRYDVRNKELTDMLIGRDNHSVLAVFGQRGSGKTHLVMDVYASVRKYFFSFAWISLAQCSNTSTDVLRRMTEELQIRNDNLPQKPTDQQYIELLNKHNRFMFVLDDVQMPDAILNALHESFDNKGSRIIIITRVQPIREFQHVKSSTGPNTMDQPEPSSKAGPAPACIEKEVFQTPYALSDSEEEAEVQARIDDANSVAEEEEFQIPSSSSKLAGPSDTAQEVFQTPSALSDSKEETEFQKRFDVSDIPDLEEFHISYSSSEPAGPSDIAQEMFQTPSSLSDSEEDAEEEEIQIPSSSSEPARPSDTAPMEFLEHTCFHHDDAFNLFCTKAFGRPSDCPGDLHQITRKIIELCNFLPQTIVSVGAALNLKEKTETVWKEMAQQIEYIKHSHSSLNDVQKILYVSYKNIPMHLKNCLLYCSIFPAGFLLLAETLVRLWTAEGFLEEEGSLQLEEIAEQYIKHLIHLGYLHVVDEDELGRVASCRMPIVVHEMAVSISQKENFGAALHGVKLANMDSNIRCLFISEYPEDIDAVEDFPYFRTLIASNNAAAYCPSLPASLQGKLSENATAYLQSLPASLPPKLSDNGKAASYFQSFTSLLGNLKYLTVLELQGSPIEHLPSYIGSTLFNLRYLGLRNTKVRHLPSSMRRLYGLQTLDLKWSRMEILPNWIGNLVRLRHLFADTLVENGSATNRTLCLKSLEPPIGVKYLKELQTLDTVQATASFEKHVHKLTQLTRLSVVNRENGSSKTLFASLSKLPSLSSLLVSANKEESLNFETLSTDRLEKLVIRGRLANRTFQCSIFKSEMLKVLELIWCNMSDDSLTMLSTNLPNLEYLSLHGITGITKLIFQSGNSFAKLRTLKIREISEVEELDIPNGSLRNLRVLHVESLQKLQPGNIRDLEKIKSVTDLYFSQLMTTQRRNQEA